MLTVIRIEIWSEYLWTSSGSNPTSQLLQPCSQILYWNLPKGTR